MTTTWSPKGLRRASISDDLCTLCDLPAATHARCRDCSVLAGPGHVVTSLEDGRCGSCARLKRRRAQVLK